MLHGRVLRPDNARAKLVELEAKTARAPIAGLVAVVRDGNFAGVVSETEHGAEAALQALRKGATWSAGETLPDENELAAFLKAQPSESTVIDKRTASRTGAGKRTIRRQYTRPYIAHASIAPSCAMAQWNGDRVHVWTHSQGVYLLRADLALVLKLPVENITVEHMEGAGCYGHNAADDVALDAVLLAKAAGGRPVRVQWSREDEMSHAPFGAAMAIEIEADLDAAGRDRRLAPFDLEQRPRRAAGARSAACAARGDRTGQSVSAHDLDQSAAGQWRRRRSQLDSAL